MSILNSILRLVVLLAPSGFASCHRPVPLKGVPWDTLPAFDDSVWRALRIGGGALGLVGMITVFYWVNAPLCQRVSAFVLGACALGGIGYMMRRALTHWRPRGRDLRRLGPYLVREQIGEGGMGRVFRGQHSLLHRDSAIKVMNQPDDGRSGIRFEQEVRLTAKLRHPNTVTVFDCGRTDDGQFYYAMELIDGQTLEEVVQATGPLSARRAVPILRQIASALAEAHHLGLVHRDIKPVNIMLTEVGGERDVAKVLDFGLAQDLQEAKPGESQANTVLGTPDYMAPEIINAPERVNASADLYALGAVGYFLLSGRRLFDAKSSIEVCMHQLHSQPTPIEEVALHPLPFTLAALIEQCLQKDPLARPASADDMVATLEDIERTLA